MNEENTRDGLSLKNIFSIFKAHWIAILFLMIVGALGGGFAFLAKYQSSIKVGIIDRLDTSENTNTLIALRLTYSFKDYVAQRELDCLIKVDEEKYKDLRYSQIVSWLNAEIYFSNVVFNDLKKHNSITLGDTNYVLIEISLFQEYFDIVSIVDELVYSGYRPIIAHPERYSYLSISDIKNY